MIKDRSPLQDPVPAGPGEALGNQSPQLSGAVIASMTETPYFTLAAKKAYVKKRI